MVAQVDPEDDTIRRFIVRHYAFDPERHERRHITVAAFDNQAEFESLVQRLATELKERRELGDEVDWREHYTGVVLDPGYTRLQQNGRIVRDALARGVSLDRLADIELPPNMGIFRSRTNEDGSAPASP
jgi:hypothetical protein